MTGVEVEGLTRFQTTTRTAAADLADLAGARHDAAQLLLDQADVPYDTGELEGSGHVDADVAAWSAEHAMPVHQGVPSHNIEAHPWVPQTIAANTGGVEQVFTDEVTGILSRVKGR